MDIMTDRNSLVILRRLASRKRTSPIVPPRPQKAAFGEVAEYKYFPRSSPESNGVPSEVISDFLRELKETKHTAINTVTVLRHGVVIGEAEYYPYRFDTWHAAHSFTKSVTGLAVGMLIDDGKLSLDDKILKIFANRGIQALNITQRNLTVRHLLNMTSGIKFNEFGMVTESDWVRCFLESVPQTEPGSKFEYNSMNSYMLSAIVTQITGMPLADFLEKRLFSPLGITRKCFETCPCGNNKGGWGLYLLPEDMAKIGYLILRKGDWNGRRIVSEKWISLMTTKQATVPKAVSDYNYGYQIWVKDEPKVFCLNGMFGQNTMVFPDTDIVVTLTAANENLFHDNESFEMCERYFGNASAFSASPLPKRASAYAALKREQKAYRRPPYKTLKAIRRLTGGDRLPKECDDYDGLSFCFAKNDTASVGLLPLTLQCLQNCFTFGTSKVSFERVGHRFYVTFLESDRLYRLPVGFEKARYADLIIGGDSYKVAVMGRFFVDEDGNDMFKIFIYYLEFGNIRTVRFMRQKNRIYAKWNEKPGVDFFVNGVAHLLGDIKNLMAVKGMLDRGGTGLLRYTALSSYEPEAVGLMLTDN